MDHFAGLDVSTYRSRTRASALWMARGKIARDLKVASKPGALLGVLRNAAYHFKRIASEAAPLHAFAVIKLSQPLDFVRPADACRIFALLQINDDLGTYAFVRYVEGVMSTRMHGFVVTLIGGLALAACAADGASLGDAGPLPSGSVPLPRPAPQVSTAAAPVIPTWQHVPEPVSAQQFDRDKAKCTEVAKSAPGVGSPEVKFYLAFTRCMRSEGYEATSSL